MEEFTPEFKKELSRQMAMISEQIYLYMTRLNKKPEGLTDTITDELEED